MIHQRRSVTSSLELSDRDIKNEMYDDMEGDDEDDAGGNYGNCSHTFCQVEK